jgi:hypothetical protein
MNIEFGNYSYFINKQENETNNSFRNRIWFLVKQNPVDEKEFKKAIKLSKLFINNKHLNCEYNDKVNKLLI